MKKKLFHATIILIPLGLLLLIHSIDLLFLLALDLDLCVWTALSHPPYIPLRLYSGGGDFHQIALVLSDGDSFFKPAVKNLKLGSVTCSMLLDLNLLAFH